MHSASLYDLYTAPLACVPDICDAHPLNIVKIPNVTIRLMSDENKDLIPPFTSSVELVECEDGEEP